MRNIHIDERLMFEHMRERQREIERRYLLKSLRTPGPRLLLRLLCALRERLRALGRRRQQHRRHDESTACPTRETAS